MYYYGAHCTCTVGKHSHTIIVTQSCYDYDMEYACKRSKNTMLNHNYCTLEFRSTLRITFTSTPATTIAVSQTSALLSLSRAACRAQQSQPRTTQPCALPGSFPCRARRAGYKQFSHALSRALSPVACCVQRAATSNSAVRLPALSHAARNKPRMTNLHVAVPSSGLLNLPPATHDELATSNSAMRSISFFPCCLLCAMSQLRATQPCALPALSLLLFLHQALALDRSFSTRETIQFRTRTTLQQSTFRTKLRTKSTVLVHND